MKSKIVITLLTVITSVLINKTSYAQLSVENINGVTSSGVCDGNIDINAAGNAGPFDLVLSPAGSSDISASNDAVQGTASLSGLCEGTYDVYAINRFGCSHSLGSVTIGVGSNLTSDPMASNRLGKSKKEESSFVRAFDVRYFPNPFATDVTIQITAEYADEYEIVMSDVVGKIVYDQKVSVKKGLNNFLISNIRNGSSGVFLVKILGKDKRVLESFKLFKLESGQDD